MATGRHWEWRGFGNVSNEFRDNFASFPLAFPEGPEWLDVTDEYLWVPDCNINVKLRTGHQEGLKLKRFEERHHTAELWFEDPKELYPYSSLDAAAFQSLGEALKIKLPPIQDGPFDRRATLEILGNTRPPVQIVKVQKSRQTRLWGTGDSQVLVEIANITHPQGILSVSLENAKPIAGQNDRERLNQAREALLFAMEALNIRKEDLKIMNYLEALSCWANQGSI